jgi:hypothetical protein
VSSGIQPGEAIVERQRSGRDWTAVGIGLAAALAVVGLYAITIWAVVVLIQALV